MATRLTIGTGRSSLLQVVCLSVLVGSSVLFAKELKAYPAAELIAAESDLMDSVPLASESLQISDRRFRFHGTNPSAESLIAEDSYQDASEAEVLPTLALPVGWNLNDAFSTPSWLTLSASILSQNNGTISGLANPQFTSSNLLNFGFRLSPFSGPGSHLTGGTDAPRQGVDYGNHFSSKIAINGLLTQRIGNILSSYIPNQLNTQWNFGNGPVGRLGFLNIEYKDERNFVSMLKLGKLMQAQDFTMNPVQCYFSNFGFCGWAQGTPSMIDIPGNPFNSYGGVVAFGPSDTLNFRYGIYQVAPATFAPELHGFDFRFNQGIGFAQFAELRIPVDKNSQLPVLHDHKTNTTKSSTLEEANMLYQSLLPPGTITFGGWLGSGDFPTVADPSINQSTNNGAYGIISLRIPNFFLGLDNRVFASAGLGLSTEVQQFRSGGNAGVVIAGVLPQRPFDTLSLGMSYASYNQDYYLPGLDAESFTPNTEFALEANYSINISQNTRLMPNIQIILNRGGDQSSQPAIVGGLQIWYLF